MKAAKPWIKINSFDELIKHEKEIVKRISGTPNGGNLFMAHPIMLLADIGVVLSNQGQNEIISREPGLSNLSPSVYNSLKKSKTKQKIRFHIKGLFQHKGTFSKEAT